MIDDKEFFRQVTTRICGTLEIEKALSRCFLFLKDYLPVDQIRLNFPDPRREAIHFFASADENGGRLVNQFFPIPASALEWINSQDAPPVAIIDRPEDHPVAGPIIKNMELPEVSLMVLRLTLEGVIVGGLIMAALGRHRFTPEHMRLISLVREPLAIALSNGRRYYELLELKESLVDDNRYLQGELHRAAGEEIIGVDFGLREVMNLVRKVAPLPSPVLILGPTGVGKEVIANAVHRLSARSQGPFIRVNCGAIPETLVDSELFGHEKGAFTGALARKRGRFERAHGGTIFLDEVGELRPEAQIRLLRVLQEHEIERVGGTAPVPVDVRLVAATHRDLAQLVATGEFREDLYFRLQVFPLRIPPLRERRMDVPALVAHFLKIKCREHGLKIIPALAPAALERLARYEWPGNVRELEHAVERALILNPVGPLTFDHFDAGPWPGKPSGGQVEVSAPAKVGDIRTLDQVMAEHIRLVLTRTAGRVGGPQGAARLLGVDPGTLRFRMKKLGIPFGRKAGMGQV